MTKQSITISEAAAKLLNMAEHGNPERRLSVCIHSPGGIGGTPTVDVIGIHNGIDWDASKILLHTSVALTTLTAEQAQAITESVRMGQSWHAQEAYRVARLKLADVENERDAMGRALKAIVDGLGLATHYPNREAAPNANLAELVIEAAKAQKLRVVIEETPEEGAEPAPVGPMKAERDERGLWRHPDYPFYGTGEDATAAYAAWFKAQGLSFTSTWLVAPGAEDDLITDNYSHWTVVPPNGAHWFLLAIEEFENGPVCVWGWRQPTE